MFVQVPLAALLIGTFLFGGVVGFLTAAILSAIGREAEQGESVNQ